MVRKLEKSLYVKRGAALNWAEAYTKVLLAMGYEKVCPFVACITQDGT